MEPSDRELLRAFSKGPSAAHFQPLLDRYLGFVHSAAYRQVGNEEEAVEVACAVFLAFARRARSLSRKTVLVEWFFRATRLASAKAIRNRQARKTSIQQSGGGAAALRDDDTWARLVPLLDRALERLRVKHRDAVLLCSILQWSLADAAQALRTKESRVAKRAAVGFEKLVRRLRKQRLLIEAESLRAALLAHGCAVEVSPELRMRILSCVEESVRRRPGLALARSTLRALTWERWKRRLKIAGAALGLFVVLLGSVAGVLVFLWNTGQLLPWLVEFGARQQAKQVPELAIPVRPWPQDPSLLPGAQSLRTARDLYQSTNIWLAHLRFSPENWTALKPKRVPAVPKIMQPDGTIVLRNPKARRNGVAGALGFDFNWTRGDLEFSGLLFTNVAARLRGNGTYLGSLFGSKHPYKVDLNKFQKSHELAGVHTLNFINLIEDRSYMNDLLGYELFRAAGIPAPGTAYAWLNVSVQGQIERKPLGLYLLVENVDADFAEAWFGSRKAPIFKPVTPDLFEDLGDDWAAYDRIYDLKTKATPEQKRRVIDFARLLTHADDAQLEHRVGEFLDLDEVGRFLAGLVLIANYDSLLTYGQNYYLYLDPRTGKFGFIPWDMDQAWGSFPQFGTAVARERASIWHPWVGRNRFLERLLRIEEFRRIYRGHLEQLLATAFTPDRLYQRIDEMAPVIRGAITAESSFRLRLFEQAISTNWLSGPRDGGEGPKRPVHEVKRFIVNRAKSVRDQLDGRSQGIVLRRAGDFGP